MTDRSNAAPSPRAGPILKYYLYVATQSAWFLTPVWTVFLLDQGLSYTQIGVLNGAWFAAIVFGEVPTGYLADRIGRRNGLFLGALAQAVAVAVFGFLHSFAAILVLYVTWGVGSTFRSGSDSAWLYDTLQEQLAEEEFTRIKGRGTAIQLVASGASAVAGGYLAGVDLYYPFLLSAVVIGIGGLVVLTIPETAAFADGTAERLTVTDALPVVRDTLFRPPLRRFVLYTTVTFALGWSIVTYTQPMALRLGFDAAGLGWLYAGFTVVSAVLANAAERIERVVGVTNWVRTVPVVLGTLYVATAFLPALAIPTFFAMRALLRTTTVLEQRYLNDRAAALGRATVLSAASMVYSLARIPFRLVAGPLADRYSPVVAIGVMGALLLFAMVLLRVRAPLTSASSGRVAPSSTD